MHVSVCEREEETTRHNNKKKSITCLSNTACYRTPQVKVKARSINMKLEKTCRVQPVHCSVIWPSAWMEDLNIMTFDITEPTCWLHSSGSALRQGGLCLCDTAVLKLPAFVFQELFFFS